SVAFADEIVVVDSRSADRTVEIAQAAGARVLVRPFDDWSQQKNWALERCTHPWVLCLDADERVDATLAGAIAALPDSPAADGYRLARRNRFLGHPIRHSGWQDDRVVRLFRRERGRFAGAIHESVRGLERIVDLPGALDHEPYATWGDYERKLWRYARAGARAAYDAGRRCGPWPMLFRPPARFLRMYVAQAGFRDGGPGLALCGLSAIAVFLKYAFLWDATRRGPEVLAAEERG
ncbi:MAG: glycosyltransferase family 2 protein, partial [Candidatus Eisenbacteria bacterium]